MRRVPLHQGILKQIRLQWPGWITDWEVQQHIKDHLFHGVHKHTGDFIRYLYSNPRTTYSQFMITAHKAENKNEEVWDKVRTRSVMTTKPVQRHYRVSNSNSQVDGSPDQSRTGQQLQQYPKESQTVRPWQRMDRQKHSWLPWLPQWLNWPGTDHLSPQCNCQSWHRDHRSRPGTECPRVQR